MQQQWNTIVEMDTLCAWKRNMITLDHENSSQLILLNKLFHEVSGTGYKCKLERRSMNCSEWLLFETSRLKSDWIPIRISERECWDMVNSKRCVIEDANLNKRMKCDANGCSSEDGLVSSQDCIDWIANAV